jgi:hypothetical protein
MRHYEKIQLSGNFLTARRVELLPPLRRLRNELPIATWSHSVIDRGLIRVDAVEKRLAIFGEKIRHRRFAVMGRQTGDQSQLFYLFNIERRVPANHLSRRRVALCEHRKCDSNSLEFINRAESGAGLRAAGYNRNTQENRASPYERDVGNRSL